MRHGVDCREEGGVCVFVVESLATERVMVVM